jgi:hypothetical protein
MRAYEFINEQITAPTLVPDETIDPDEEWDPKEHSADEVQARITQIEKQIANTPVNQYVDAGNGDKRLLRISPNDATKMEKGINPNPEIQRMPWTGAPQKTLPNVGDMKRGYQA